MEVSVSVSVEDSVSVSVSVAVSVSVSVAVSVSVSVSVSVADSVSVSVSVADSVSVSVAISATSVAVSVSVADSVELQKKGGTVQWIEVRNIPAGETKNLLEIRQHTNTNPKERHNRQDRQEGTQTHTQ